MHSRLSYCFGFLARVSEGDQSKQGCDNIAHPVALTHGPASLMEEDYGPFTNK